MHKLLRLTFLAAILLVVGCGTPDPSLQLPSSVIWVAPQDNPNESTVFATINAAVQAANGRLIKVRAGTYKESVNVPASATIRLEGESDGLVILIPPDEKPAWSLGEKSDVQVSNLQIEAGLRGFVVAAGSSLSLKNIKINNVVGQAVFSQQATISLLNVSIKNVKRPSEAQFDKIGQGQAVRVEGGKLVVDGCTFEKTANRGVNVLKQGIATISDSTFVGEKTQSVAAIAFQESQGTVTRVTLKQWKEGIFLLKGSIMMEDSTIEDSAGNGLLISDSSWYRLQNNTIKNSAKSGLSSSNSSGHLLNNTIDGSQEYGIFLFQKVAVPQVLVENNTVTNSKAAGIQVFNTNATIVGNKVSGTKLGASQDDGHGIAALDTDNVQILNNETKDNVGAGIFMLRSWGRVSENKVENNKETGIFISEAPTGKSSNLVLNQIVKNRIAGVFVLKSVVFMLENRVAETVFSKEEQSGSGVVIFGGSEATIGKDNYEKNEQDGLLIASNSKANVTSTTFAGNKRWGIFLDCSSSTLKAEQNTFSGNGQGEKNTCR